MTLSTVIPLRHNAAISALVAETYLERSTQSYAGKGNVEALLTMNKSLHLAAYLEYYQ